LIGARRLARISRPWRFIAAAVLIALSVAAAPALSQQSSKSAGRAELRITGAAGHPLVLHDEDLLAMKRQSVAVTGEKGGKAVYEGVPVADLLERAGAPLKEKLRGPAIALYVVAEAADGYRAVFAITEFDSAFTSQTILLADRRDGHPLTSADGPFKIIVPAEKRHARWVRQVTALDLQRAR